jgi:Zn-finger nucleic acid-binding protein
MTHGAGMLCPSCKVDLVMTDRQNIEIDYCPKCRGVWLDRGELDKIIEKSLSQPLPGAAAAPASPIPTSRPAERYDDRRPAQSPDWRRDDDDDDRRYHGGHKGYRRKSWLTEIFD